VSEHHAVVLDVYCTNRPVINLAEWSGASAAVHGNKSQNSVLVECTGWRHVEEVVRLEDHPEALVVGGWGPMGIFNGRVEGGHLSAQLSPHVLEQEEDMFRSLIVLEPAAVPLEILPKVEDAMRLVSKDDMPGEDLEVSVHGHNRLERCLHVGGFDLQLGVVQFPILAPVLGENEGRGHRRVVVLIDGTARAHWNLHLITPDVVQAVVSFELTLEPCLFKKSRPVAIGKGVVPAQIIHHHECRCCSRQ